VVQWQFPRRALQSSEEPSEWQGLLVFLGDDHPARALRDGRATSHEASREARFGAPQVYP
jgi:hypothetical protein